MSDDVEVRILNKKEVADKIKEMLENDPQFKAVEVKVENPEGIFIEYGTKPAKKQHGRGKSNVVYQRFIQWYGAKDSNGKSTAFLIYDDIMRNGIEERPFFRPAIHNIEADIKSGKYKNPDLKKIGDDLSKEMVRIYDEGVAKRGSKGGPPSPPLVVTVKELKSADDVATRDSYSDKIRELDEKSSVGNYPGKSRKPRIKRK